MKRSQLRAARALLSWSQERLSEAAGVSVSTVKRLEPGDGALETRVETQNRLQSALESAGVVFVEQNGEGPGVRLKKHRSPEKLAEIIKTLDDEHAEMGERPSPKKALNRMKAAIAADVHKKARSKK